MTTYLEHEHHIHDFETDINGFWRLDYIFRNMQELASRHSDILHVGKDTLAQYHIVWMLARAHIKMDRYPRTSANVHIRTWPGVPGKITMSRFFEFYDTENVRLGYCSTSWILVDIQSRRIILTQNLQFQLPGYDNTYPDPLPEPKKFRLPLQEFTQTVERTPLYCDIDTNGHMNNANYISWILDMFPLSQYATERIGELKINYASEARPGLPTQLLSGKSGNEFCIRGIDSTDTHTIFEAIGSWMSVK